MKKRNSAGFTIIELMVGMITMAIIALTVGILLVSGWIRWRQSTESVEMQRNAMVAMRILEHGIRNSETDGIGGLGTQELSFSTPTDSEPVPNFKAEEFAEGSFVNLNSFSATTNELGGVEVTFTLSTTSGTDTNVYTLTVYPRNGS